MMSRAHQMVDMLTEENKMLRQEMEAFREKVSKLQKVGAAGRLTLAVLTTPPLFYSASRPTAGGG